MSVTEQEQHEQDFAETTPEPDGSLLGKVRARRAALALEKTREFEMVIPGYEGLLGVRYRYPWADAERVITLAQRLATSLLSDQVQARFDENVDLVVKCCHELVGRQSLDAEWTPFDPHPDPERPLRFNDRLAGLLEIPLPETGSRARFIARNVFSPEAVVSGVYSGDPQLAQHAIAVAGWLQRNDASVEEALQGE